MTNTYHYCYNILTTTAIISILILNDCQQEVSSYFIGQPKTNVVTNKPPLHQHQRFLTSSTNSLGSKEKNMNTEEIDVGALEHIADNVFLEDKRPIILFDGICNMCNSAVNYALDYDSIGNFRFASLQSKIGQSLLLKSGKAYDDLSSIVLVTPSKVYFKTDAVVRIMKGLDPMMLKATANVASLFPSFIVNFFYEMVGANRYIFGERDMCRIELDGEFEDRFIPDP